MCSSSVDGEGAAAAHPCCSPAAALAVQWADIFNRIHPYDGPAILARDEVNRLRDAFLADLEKMAQSDLRGALACALFFATETPADLADQMALRFQGLF